MSNLGKLLPDWFNSVIRM